MRKMYENENDFIKLIFKCLQKNIKKDPAKFVNIHKAGDIIFGNLIILT